MVIDSVDTLDVDVDVGTEVEVDTEGNAKMSEDVKRQARRGMRGPNIFGVRILDMNIHCNWVF